MAKAPIKRTNWKAEHAKLAAEKGAQRGVFLTKIEELNTENGKLLTRLKTAEAENEKLSRHVSALRQLYKNADAIAKGASKVLANEKRKWEGDLSVANKAVAEKDDEIQELQEELEGVVEQSAKAISDEKKEQEQLRQEVSFWQAKCRSWDAQFMALSKDYNALRTLVRIVHGTVEKELPE